jgi:hypothetical protein
MSKYNPEEDSNYPKVGDIIDNEKKSKKSRTRRIF